MADLYPGFTNNLTGVYVFSVAALAFINTYACKVWFALMLCVVSFLADLYFHKHSSLGVNSNMIRVCVYINKEQK